jgi:hypothetical protein
MYRTVSERRLAFVLARVIISVSTSHTRLHIVGNLFYTFSRLGFGFGFGFGMRLLSLVRFALDILIF